MPPASRPASRRSKNTPPATPRWLKWVVVLACLSVAAASGGLAFAGALENHDPFCASCHSEPESTFVGREGAPASDLASAHAPDKARCIDCHSGPGLSGRLDTLRTLAIGDLIAYETGHYNNPAILTQPIPDANCLKCHADLPKRTDFNNHFHALLSRWQAADAQNAGTCVECHHGHATDGDATLKFLNRDQTLTVCQRCHQFAGEGGE